MADRPVLTARVSELIAELGARFPNGGDELTIMRDRVVWMPNVIPINPPVP